MNNASLQPWNGREYPAYSNFCYPPKGQIRPRLVFDGGNRFLKWLDPSNQIRSIRSCIKEISDYQWRRIKADAETVLVEVEDKRFLIGKLAQELGGEPTFQKDKCQLADILVLAAIEPNPGYSHVRVEKLAIALPNTLNHQDVAAVRRIANHPLTKEFTLLGTMSADTSDDYDPCAVDDSITPVGERFEELSFSDQLGLAEALINQIKFSK